MWKGKTFGFIRKIDGKKKDGVYLLNWWKMWKMKSSRMSLQKFGRKCKIVKIWGLFWKFAKKIMKGETLAGVVA